MSRKRRLRHLTRYVAAGAGIVTLAGTFLLAAAPAQAGTAVPRHGTHTSAAAASTGKAGRTGKATAQADKSAAQHYTDAGCNTASLKANYASCFAMVYTAIKNKIAATPDQPPPTALGPSDIQSAYKLPANAGQGQTVAIVDAYGDSTAESDLATFRSFYGLPPCTTANGCFQKVDQNGGTNYPPDNNSPNGGWDLEQSLDLDAVSAACPNCHILLVQGNDNSLQNLGIAENTAVSLGAKYVSNSYGVLGETSTETQFDQYYEHPGVAIDAATGDAGNVTNWPATNPDVAGIGGTTLTKDTSVPRGWDETAWADGGSGCSPYEPHPDYQNGINTDCPNNKAIADISADADPNSGLATYDTNGEGGWLQVGGTSLATPLVTAMYALAGPPVPGTFPVTYPYQDPNQSNDLFDVTQGSNGGCGNVLCNAGPGWDGPTGLGTPDGVNALTTGPHGDIAGEVTDKTTHNPIAGVTVTATGGFTATTNSSGNYDLTVPVGSYSLTAQAYGYKKKSVASVQVNQGQTTTENFALASVPSHTLSGTITDGSGHGYPLYAKISISGYPGNAVYTNPYTGQYSVTLAQGATYTLSVTPVYPGYNTATASVHIGASDVTKNVKVTVNQSTCSAPGYAYKYSGTTEGFTGWTGNTAQDGWSVVDNEGNGETWLFGANPTGEGAPPNTDGQFAIADSNHYPPANSQDTSLVSPVENLSGDTTPVINFDTWYNEFPFNQKADVDISLDGGQTWTNVWEQTTTSVDGHVSIPIPQAAGQSDVQVRFHFISTFGWWWSMDNVFIGNQKCVATPGGYVDGIVTDHNTSDPINGATVASQANPGQAGVSQATPDDPNLSDGFYWLFATPAGATPFKASDGNYTPSTQTVNVVDDAVVHQDWSLQAGHLSITPGSLSVTQTLGAATTKTVKFSNDGTEPMQVKLSEQDGGFTPMTGKASAKGAPLQQIKGTFSPDAMVKLAKTHAGAFAKARAAARQRLQLRQPTPNDPPWTSIANYPTSIMDNAVGFDGGSGKVYSIAGFNGSANVASSYVYDPSSQQWSQIADAPQALEAPAGAFLNGKMYVVGGWDSSGNASSTVYAYDPSSGSWAQEASLPAPLSAPAATVLNGQLYVVGGCTTGNCSPTSNAVYRYDPSGNSWSQLANYPTPVAFAACAGINGQVVCAGGTDADTNTSLKSTYIYDPGSNTWSQGADMPFDDWAMAYSGSGNQLQIAGGVTNDNATVTNQAAEYDPSSNSWSALPNANNAEYRGGGACGLYKIGGSTGQFAAQNFAEVLPGFDSCGTEDVPWLSESTDAFTLSPGQSQTVAVTMDSSAVSQPGAYAAKLTIGTDSPYQFAPIGVAMQANPPAAWSKVAGTVTDASTGNPIAGATVQICTQYNKSTGTCGQVTYTLKTDSSGSYQLWLNRGFNPLQIIAAKDGYQPATKLATLIKGIATTVNFALNKS
jgi:N-acetylneuraminic acid mutarotase